MSKSLPISDSDVVVTGLGVVSPIGVGVPLFSESLFSGLSGVKSIRGNRVPDDFPIPDAATIDSASIDEPCDWGSSSKEAWKNLQDSARYAVTACAEAIATLDNRSSVDAIVYGSAEGINYHRIVDDFGKKLRGKDWLSIRPQDPLEKINAFLVGRGFKEIHRRRTIAVNSACASGNQAIGIAFQRIQKGDWERAIVGGVDARCNASNLMNFHMLGALNSLDIDPEKASCPFSVHRNGFVRGEGAATLVLESGKAAKKRGATPLGKVLGYGFTTDAYRLTDGREDALCVTQAMRSAIEGSGRSKSLFNAISAHGTSTKLNDRLETKAIKEVFGDHSSNLFVTALKSQIGHATVAAGALQAVSCLLMLQQQMLAPTLNYTPGDPECDLDYVPDLRRSVEMNTFLSNSFGFGGHNACVAFGL